MPAGSWGKRGSSGVEKRKWSGGRLEAEKIMR